MRTAFALLPILLFAALMIGARWSAAAAGATGALVAVVVAATVFGHGSEGLLPALVGPLAEAGFSSLTILWIIFAALAIHEIQSRSGAVRVLAAWLSSFGRDPRLLVLFVAWFFALFLEGAAGFGTPLAMAAPLLVGLGFPPLQALLLVLVGHAIGVSFGAVGTPILPLLDVSPHDPHRLSVAIALLHVLPGAALAAWLVHGAGSATSAPTSLHGGARLLPALAVVLFLVPYVSLAWAIGPELPTLGGALIGLLLFAWTARRLQRGKAGTDDIDAPRVAAVAAATLPYLLVIVLVLATRLLPPLREGLRDVVVAWSLDGGYGGQVLPLYHPGTLLLLGVLLAALLRPPLRAVTGPGLRAALLRLPRVALALLAVLLMARTMVHAGMIDQLASSAAAQLGTYWLAAAPATGALGSFVTGSATTSNILFGGFQQATAQAAGVSPLLAAAGQGVGAAIGNIIAPHNIVVGAAAVGLIGAEGQVLRRTLPLCAAYVAVAGGLLLLAARWL